MTQRNIRLHLRCSVKLFQWKSLRWRKYVVLIRVNVSAHAAKSDRACCWYGTNRWRYRRGADVKFWSGKTRGSALLIIISRAGQAGTTNVQIFLFLSWLACSRASISFSRILSFSFSLFLSFSRSAGRIDIRARMRLWASSTSSFTWLPQERGPVESISHTDVSTSSLSPRAPRTLWRSFSSSESKSGSAKRIFESLINLPFLPCLDWRVQIYRVCLCTCESTCMPNVRARTHARLI